MNFRFKFDPHDLWIGLYWTPICGGYTGNKTNYRFYICLIPTLCISFDLIL